MIPGITDRNRYPRIGVIRLGEKRQGQGGREYPARLNHFNLADAPAVESVYGARARTFAPVVLPCNGTKGQHGWEFPFWQTSRSAYGSGSGLFCRCTDGSSALRVHKGLVDDEKHPRHGKPADEQGHTFIQQEGLQVDVGDLFEMPCGGETCPYWQLGRCKALGRFQFVLPKVPGFGVWEIRTSSFNSIRNVESVLQAVADATGGYVAGIPFVLNLVDHQAQVKGKATTVYVLELVCPLGMEQLAAYRRKALESGGAPTALLDAPDDTPDDLYAHGGAELDADLGTGERPHVLDGVASAIESGAT